jgi:hypothetical protein
LLLPSRYCFRCSGYRSFWISKGKGESFYSYRVQVLYWRGT